MDTHWECLVYPLFVSIMYWVINGGVLPIVHFVSIMSWVLIGSVLTFVFLSPVRQGYSLGVSLQLVMCLHYVMVTHWECHEYSFGVP